MMKTNLDLPPLEALLENMINNPASFESQLEVLANLEEISKKSIAQALHETLSALQPEDRWPYLVFILYFGMSATTELILGRNYVKIFHQIDLPDKDVIAAKLKAIGIY